MENQITPNSSYPDFIRRSSLEGSIIFIFCSTLRKLNIHRLSPAYLHTMSFSFLCRWAFFFQGHHFFKHNANLSFNCIVEFSVSALPWHLNAEWDMEKLCKGKFPIGFVQLWHLKVRPLSCSFIVKRQQLMNISSPLPGQPFQPAYRCSLH